MTDGPRVSQLGDHIYDKKRRQGRPAKRWRDDLEDSTRQANLETFAKPRDTIRLPNDDDDDDGGLDKYLYIHMVYGGLYIDWLTMHEL